MCPLDMYSWSVFSMKNFHRIGFNMFQIAWLFLEIFFKVYSYFLEKKMQHVLFLVWFLFLIDFSSIHLLK